MSKPEVSIIMPVKNAEPWLSACLASIQAQRGIAWELIAVDDHSEDGSLDLLRFAQSDDRITVLKNAGQGILPALRLAMRHAKADFITRMDADDIMPSNKLHELFHLLDGSQRAVATGKVKYFSDAAISEGYTEYEAWLNERIDMEDHWKWIYRECVIASANWMTHRSNVVMEEDVYPEDYNLVFHWYNRGLEVRSTQCITHHWREHPSRTSRRSAHYQQDAFFKLKIKKFLEIDYEKDRSTVLLGSNVKSALVSEFFAQKGLDLLQLNASTIFEIDGIDRPQTLIAVYPPTEQRDEIARFLNDRSLRMGIDWWWL